LEAEKPKGYYDDLVESLQKANREYNAFNVIAESARQSENTVPFSTKSSICVKRVETTAGSRMLQGYIPPFNATVVDRLIDDGRFSFLGETNMDEFGFGTFGINAETPARNAFDKEYAAGGSSSGAAVATAMLKYHVALAVSTGGSISTPAAFNGVVGFTPTYGTVSRYGLIDYANSLDKIGVMARSSRGELFAVVSDVSGTVQCVLDKAKVTDKEWADIEAGRADGNDG
jgi:aspartyl-tRNA(Asn)/glutamyl-tRNA(Gln) amidotransferase subunit A